MGEFFEPQGDKPPKVFTQAFFEDVVKKSIDNGEVDPDAKLVFIAAADEQGIKAVVAAEIIDKEKIRIKLDGIFEHQWTGENKAGARILFQMK